MSVFRINVNGRVGKKRDHGCLDFVDKIDPAKEHCGERRSGVREGGENAEREASIGLECYIDSRRPSRFGEHRRRLLVVAGSQDLLIFRFHGLGPLQGPSRSATPVRGIRASVRGIRSCSE